jgi:hypothetical protein
MNPNAAPASSSSPSRENGNGPPTGFDGRYATRVMLIFASLVAIVLFVAAGITVLFAREVLGPRAIETGSFATLSASRSADPPIPSLPSAAGTE